MSPTERARRWAEKHGLDLSEDQLSSLSDQFLVVEVSALARMRSSCVEKALDFREDARDKATTAAQMGDSRGAARMSGLAAASTILADKIRSVTLKVDRGGRFATGWNLSKEDNPEEPVSLDKIRVLKALETEQPIATAHVGWFYGGGTRIYHTLSYNPPSHIEDVDTHDWLLDHFEEVLLGLRMTQ